jgi:hypothetical protein
MGWYEIVTRTKSTEIIPVLEGKCGKTVPCGKNHAVIWLINPLAYPYHLRALHGGDFI